MDPVWRIVLRRLLTLSERAALRRAGLAPLQGRRGTDAPTDTIVLRAADEPDAVAQVERVIGLSPIERVHLPDRTVLVDVPPHAVTLFDNTLGGRIHSVMKFAGGLVQASITVDGTLSDDEAFKSAREVYDAVLRSAGVETGPSQPRMIIGGFGTYLVNTRGRQLLASAEELCDEGQSDLAVIVAQTACEVLISDAFHSLLGLDDGPIRDFITKRIDGFSLLDKSTRDLWNGLTQTKIADETWWKAYDAHVQRRNRVVHGGEIVDRGSANASVEAASQLFAYVESLTGDARS